MTSPTERFPTQPPRHGECYVPPPAHPKKRERRRDTEREREREKEKKREKREKNSLLQANVKPDHRSQKLKKRERETRDEDK